ncbi:MAG: peroxiredoxin [Sphingomonadaceae bacterium]
MTLEPGHAAPAFTLETPEGPVSLSDFAGRKLVLWFYPKDDTSGCTSEAKDFTALVDDFAAIGVAVLDVSKDSIAKHVKFIEKHDLKVQLASDPDGETLEAYGVWVEKSMYGRKYMGIERSTFLIGPDGRILNVWRKVKVPGHAAAVLKAAQG